MAPTSTVTLLILTLWVGGLHLSTGYVEVDVAEMLSVARPMVHQLYNIYRKSEEWIRAGGQSGLKQIRNTKHGTRNYHATSVSNLETFGGYRDYASNYMDAGYGEVIAVLNGVEFRMRALDYTLTSPDPTNAEFLSSVPVTPPPVPEAVTQLPTVDEQAAEMKEWYRAWMNQNETIRPYKNFFKPVLCYVEGWWEVSGELDLLSEPHYSKLKSIHGLTWEQLATNHMFSSYAGYQDHQEEQAFLPKTLLEVEENNKTRTAQWNSRVMCHQLSRDVPLNRLKMVDDIALRVAYNIPYKPDRLNPYTRFKLNPVDADTSSDNKYQYELIDELMAEIPGLDNYQSDLRDDAIDKENFDYKTGEPLRASHYHRYFKTKDTETGNIVPNRRSFGDPTIFYAMNTQQKVSHLTTKDNCVVAGDVTSCSKIWTQRWSYAFPLELMYLTPVHSWNPYNIPNKGEQVTAGERNGEATQDKAFDGCNERHYHHTPALFFNDTEVPDDVPAVLDSDGTMRRVYPNGLVTVSNPISGVGTPRYRYPIMPLHHEGTPEARALDALKELVLNPIAHRKVYTEMIASARTHRWYKIEASEDRPDLGLPPHTHLFSLSPLRYEKLQEGRSLKVTVTETLGHSHVLYVKKMKTFPFVKVIKIDGIFFSSVEKHGFGVQEIHI